MTKIVVIIGFCVAFAAGLTVGMSRQREIAKTLAQMLGRNRLVADELLLHLLAEGIERHWRGPEVKALLTGLRQHLASFGAQRIANFVVSAAAAAQRLHGAALRRLVHQRTDDRVGQFHCPPEFRHGLTRLEMHEFNHEIE